MFAEISTDMKTVFFSFLKSASLILESVAVCLCMRNPAFASEADTVLSECTVSNQSICCHWPCLSLRVCVKAQSTSCFSQVECCFHCLYSFAFSLEW